MSKLSKILLSLLVIVLAAVGAAWYIMPELDSKNFEGSIVSWQPPVPRSDNRAPEMQMIVKLDDGREVTVSSSRRDTAKVDERIPVQEVFGWFGSRWFIELPPI